MILRPGILLVILTALAACRWGGSEYEGPVQAGKNPTACHHTEVAGFFGKEYLDQKQLAIIENIKPDPTIANNFEGMVRINGGIFEMGGDYLEGKPNLPATALPQRDELPKHPVKIKDFWIDKEEVTNAQFRNFVDATGYITVAEKPVDWNEIKKQLPPGTPKPAEKELQPGALVFNYAPEGSSANDISNWWTFVYGADWRHPEGPDSNIEGKEDHPVVQICWYDALAYAKWAGKRLPTEAEWEFAARGGKKNHVYPWGNEKPESTTYKANFLQGEFPFNNEISDGFERRAPVGSFAPNEYGLYDMAGNVWEWTSDWYAGNYYSYLKASGIAENPCGPDPQNAGGLYIESRKVIRGGSFLCNDNWCSGYRNSRRMRETPDSAGEHIGFRCVRDADG